jgi:hypothetical protein
MAKATADIRSLARSHTKTAINTLVGIMNDRDAPPNARVNAAEGLLDRGWGKAPQSLALTDADGGPLKVEVVRFGEK